MPPKAQTRPPSHAPRLQTPVYLRNLGGIITELEHTMLDEIKIEETSLYKKGKTDAATNLLREGVKAEIISKALGLTMEQIRKLQEDMNK